jgi:hypothetical protein
MYKLNPYNAEPLGGVHSNRVQSGQGQTVTSFIHTILETSCCFKKNFLSRDLM